MTLKLIVSGDATQADDINMNPYPETTDAAKNNCILFVDLNNV